MGEPDVARLLGDVDLHDPLQERVHVVPGAQHRLLHVVDRLLAGQHPHEKPNGTSFAANGRTGKTPRKNVDPPPTQDRRG